MVAFVIFWSAVFAVIFFILGIIFKGLASAFNALLTSIGSILAVGFLTGFALVALYLLYIITDGIITKGFSAVLGWIVLFIIDVAIVGALVGGLGALLLNIVVVIAEYILLAVSCVLEKAAAICETMYAKSLSAIFNRLDKC